MTGYTVKGTVFSASQGIRPQWSMKREHLSSA
ncbi:DUF4113 domain-containing protein [Rhodanobacter aciditrophus]|uniref:DUF4113 domain-containing protein n=1 Tax=Rhodanobacter aciditrophus TaxID=1623218 RepID=A0ABW4B4F7_9GAMM